MDPQSEKCPDCGTPLDSNKPTCPGCGRDVASLLSTQPPAIKSSAPEPTAKRIGEFRILHTIGRGGMGTVYEAYQESMHRKVALKVLDSSLIPSTSEVTRFEREAWIAGRLSHPNIVKVYGQGVEDDKHFIAMELVEGESLHAEIKKAKERRQEQHISDSDWRRDHIRRVVTLFVGVADALEHVHQQGIVHRDIKPLNLLLTKNGSRLLLTDFGLARDEEASRMTRKGDFLGTVRYMSPEQLLAHRAKVDRRSDIWSLGVSLYEAVTLGLPYTADSEEAYISAVSTKEPVPARRRNRAVQRDLETVLMKCLERDPERRYSSAKGLKNDLERYLSDKSVVARRAGIFLKTTRLVRRHRIVLGAAVLAALAVYGIMGTISRRSLDEQYLAQIRQRLERVVIEGKSPDSMEKNWPELQARLHAEIQKRPQGPLANLASLAAASIVVRIEPVFGLLSNPPMLSWWVEPSFDPGPGIRYLALVEGALDDGPWRPLVRGAYAGRMGTPRCSTVLNRIYSSRELTPAPHRIALRAEIVLVPVNAKPQEQESSSCSVGETMEALTEWTKAKRSDRKVMDLGTIAFSIYSAYPLDFPRRIEPADDDEWKKWFRVDRIRILRARFQQSGGKCFQINYPDGEWFMALPPTVGTIARSEHIVAVEFFGQMNADIPVPLAGELNIRGLGERSKMITFPLAFGAGIFSAKGGLSQGIAGGKGMARFSFPVQSEVAEVGGKFPDGGMRAEIDVVPSREIALETGLFDKFLGRAISFQAEVDVQTLDAIWVDDQSCPTFGTGRRGRVNPGYPQK